ncbi:ATP-grasp domain-containing protein [Noviherbaspirillum saxi]|nr:ATP-grasp domain-containing protein [Noviherbaspirillum saxi]
MQVLLAIHSFTRANCVVICPGHIRYLHLSNMCSKILFIELNEDNENAFTEAVNQCAQMVPSPILISVDCESTRIVNKVRRQLRVTTARAPDNAMLELFDNKWRFYDFCKQNNLNVPSTQLVPSKNELNFLAVVREIGLPFILKPLDQHGAEGVRLILSEKHYSETILGDDRYDFKPLLAQRFIRGVDIGLNILSILGKVQALAIQYRAYPQNEEAKISFIPNSYLEIAARILCGSSGYDGVMNVDARLEEGSGKVYLFEANPRYWVSLSASVWCGLNFLSENLKSSYRSSEVRLLTSGKADTFYHPLFRPVFWPYILFDYGWRGRMARLMAGNVCTLGNQVRTTLKNGFKKNLPPGVPTPNHSVWTNQSGSTKRTS